MAHTLIDRMRTRPFNGAVSGLAFEVGGSEALNKESVRYSASAEGAERCGSCWHFIADEGTARCQIVEGTVAAEGACAVWAPKG